MNCPFCNSENITVTNSRVTYKNKQVWRRRKCDSCHGIFTTYESIDLSYLKIIKRSSKTVRYNRAKLFAGIYRAAIQSKNIDKGDMAILSENITKQVENEIIELHLNKVKSVTLGEIVLKIMSKYDWSLFFNFLAYFKSKSGRNEVRKYLEDL